MAACYLDKEVTMKIRRIGVDKEAQGDDFKEGEVYIPDIDDGVSGLLTDDELPVKDGDKDAADAKTGG